MTAAAVEERCFCGSGRLTTDCHELPRHARRRRRAELDALAEAHDLAALFPGVRPCDAVLEAYAASTASELDPAEPAVPVDAVEAGLLLLSAAERRRLVDTWVAAYHDRWRRIVEPVDDVQLVERAVTAGAVRMLLLEHRPLPAALFALLEGGTFRHYPANALTLLVPPPAVWSMDEACAVLLLLPRPARFDPGWFDAVEGHAGGCVGPEHVERLRRAGSRIAAQLPVVGLPRATETVAAGIAEIDADEGWAGAIAARLLALYASSPGPADEIRAQAAARNAHATV